MTPRTQFCSNKIVFKGRDMSHNHAEDMVAPLTPNVCITHHAVLNAIAYIFQTVYDVTSSLGDWFSVSRKGGTGQMCWCIHQLGKNGMAVSWFGCKIHYGRGSRPCKLSDAAPL